jgi:hypothetical protein
VRDASKARGIVMLKYRSHMSTIVSEDGATILNVEAGTITTLNPTGAYVWQALERGEAPGTITADLARETGEQTERVKVDVQRFIDSLKAHNLVIL